MERLGQDFAREEKEDGRGSQCIEHLQTFQINHVVDILALIFYRG